MAEGEFALRKLSQEEKRTTVEIGEETYNKEFKKRLVVEEQKCVKKHVPFCARCAKFDFSENVETLIRESRKRGQTLTIRDVGIVDQVAKNFDEYSKPSRFKLLDEAEVVEFTIVGNVRVPTVTGMNLNYVCNVCGGEKVGRITVFVPKKEYEERNVIKK